VIASAPVTAGAFVSSFVQSCKLHEADVYQARTQLLKIAVQLAYSGVLESMFCVLCTTSSHQSFDSVVAFSARTNCNVTTSKQ
jgi:hypothetical protein